MNQDFTGMSHIEILAAIVKNISDRDEQEIARRDLIAKPGSDFHARLFTKLLKPVKRPHRELQGAEAAVESVRSQVMRELADYLGSDPLRHARLARYISNQPIVDLTSAGATPEEISALLIAHGEPQLANVILTTGILDRMDRFDRAEWLASMLPQQPGEEVTLGR